MLGFGAISAWAISYFGGVNGTPPVDPGGPTDPTIPPGAPTLPIYTIMRDGGVNLTGNLL